MCRPDMTVCTPGVLPAFNGSAGDIYIPWADNMGAGWGNICAAVFHGLVMALLLNRRPVLVATEEERQAFGSFFTWTHEVSTADRMPKRGHSFRIDGENLRFNTSVLELLATQPPPKRAVSWALGTSWSAGSNLLRLAMARGLVDRTGCVVPYFIRPNDELMREVASVVRSRDAIHVRTCRDKQGNASAWHDTCARNKYGRTTFSAEEVVSAIDALELSRSMFIASDDGGVAQAVEENVHVTVSSFKNTGRVVNLGNQPHDVNANDLKRVLLDWLAPVGAARAFEIGGSTYWMSSMCWFRTDTPMVISGLVTTNGTRAWASNAWTCASDDINGDTRFLFRRPHASGVS